MDASCEEEKQEDQDGQVRVVLSVSGSADPALCSAAAPLWAGAKLYGNSSLQLRPLAVWHAALRSTGTSQEFGLLRAALQGIQSTASEARASAQTHDTRAQKATHPSPAQLAGL